MPTKATLYPVYALGHRFDGQIFDAGALPFPIIEGVTVEDVTSMFSRDTFAWVQRELGKHDVEELQGVEYAIVHRYETNDMGEGGKDDEGSDKLVRNLVACLRLIRPTRQRTSLMRGTLGQDGKINVQHFEHPIELLEVPEVQKLFSIRTVDLLSLREVAPRFITTMANEFWKFRMAVEFHEAGHFQDWYWKARYSLWCSALEALFTSQAPEHRGSSVAKERIKWFLGADTSIYDPGDIPDFVQPKPIISVGSVVDNMYIVRNLIAHGDKIPYEFSQQMLRAGVGAELSVLQVLIEAASFVIRKSLLRILQNNLVDHFKDAGSSELYFEAAGLTNTAIRQRQRNRP